MDPDFIDVGSELIKPIGMTDFLLRLLINVLFVIGIIHFLYYRRSRRADYYFTFAIISLSTFMIVALLGTVKLKTGFALGLFARKRSMQWSSKAVAHACRLCCRRANCWLRSTPYNVS